MGTLDATTPWGTQVSDSGPRLRVMEFARTLTDAESTALGATGVIQLCDLKAGWLILGGVFEVVTAGGATCNGQIGLTGGDTDGFMAVANMDSEAVTQLSGALLDEGYYVSAADTMDLLFDTAAPENLSYKLKLVVVDLS
jgi:hypothetical protein